ncbi:SurA N-terminal domain-containing protein [Chitiniphilus purpureus]|uniref:Periplasmic chaperone PpiD n=1 Tax=Chitiniphilus purpureus TaxID=2981137 RepID=A0ABY6DRR3_9NEIS|nr:SurA N-terminal domain-containing protein [Chitiniphilus sp. CD1]UXY17065.1 SurA N-terminal domain-containing protein [Chitiniphilus sp. CD1]
MFDIVQKNRTLVQIVLGLVALGLVVGAGVTGYSALEGDGNYLAKVDGKPITEYDVQQAVAGQPISNEMRPMVVEQLVQQRLVLAAAKRLNLTASDEQLRQAIAQMEDFHENGKFSPQRYQTLLGAQQMSPAQFEQRVRDSLTARALFGTYGATAIASKTASARLAKLIGERREIQTVSLRPEDYVARVSVTPDEVKKYYESNQSDFRVPEMVRLEYVLLSKAQLAAKQQVSDAEVQKYIDEHKAQLLGEQRRVSHILIEADKDAKPPVRQQARAEAEALRKVLLAEPHRFAELAKQHSKDPVSAAEGGELGWFGADADFVAPFKEAMLKLPKGQLSEVVETQYGYHLIRVDDIRGKSVDEVKPQVLAKLQQEKVDAQFTGQVQQFSETVYQKADSLKPAAEQFQVPVLQSGWVTRQGAQDPQLKSPKLVEAVFNDDVLKAKHNSEAVEVAPGEWISARVLEYKPAQLTPLETVRAQVEQRVKLKKAEKLVLEEGAKQLAALQAGQTLPLIWEAPREVGRVGEPGLDAQTVAALFLPKPDKLPAYAGKPAAGGSYVLYKVVSVVPAPELTPQMAEQMRVQTERMYSQVEVMRYLEDLKGQIEVQYGAKVPQQP